MSLSSSVVHLTSQIGWLRSSLISQWRPLNECVI